MKMPTVLTALAYATALTASLLAAYRIAYGSGVVVALLQSHPTIPLGLFVVLMVSALTDTKPRKGARISPKGLRSTLRLTLLGLIPSAGLGAALATFMGRGSPDWRAMALIVLGWSMAALIHGFFSSFLGLRVPLIRASWLAKKTASPR